MTRKLVFDKTEESVFTLLSLYILISQAFEALTNNEDIFNSDFDLEKGTFQELSNETIREALVYQILLKTCAYLEEWNEVFGIKTEIENKEKIIFIKKIAKPAFKNISSWKQLKEFRNHYIAHNHRNKEGKNVYLNHTEYHSPQSDAEIYLLVYSLNKMTDLVHFFFPHVAKKSLSTKKLKAKGKFLTKREIKIRIKNTESIDNFIADSIMKTKFFEAMVKSNP